MSARRATAALVALASIAAFWAVYFPQAERSVFGRVPLLDEVYYLDRAAAAPDPTEPFYMSPLYPELIALSGSAADAPGTRVFPQSGCGASVCCRWPAGWGSSYCCG